MWNTILFDLDGTITDSGEGIMKCVQYALKKGFDIEVPDYRELGCFVGPPLLEMFMDYANLNREEAAYAVELYRERYTETGLYENRVYDGIEELLIRLVNEHMTIALASSKPGVYCRRILEYFNLAQYFNVIVGSELDGRRTRKSEVIEEALRQTGMSDRREEVVMIGDRRYDIVGAKEAGLSSIGVTFGYGSRKELEEVWPDCICDSAEEVGNVLVGQAREQRWRTSPGLPPYMAYSGTRMEAADLRKTGSVLPGDGSVWKRIWRCIYPLLIDVVVSTALSSVCGIVISIISELTGSGLQGEDALIRHAVFITGVTDAVMLPIFLFLFRQDEQERRRSGGERFRIPVASAISAKGVLICVVSALALSASFELIVNLVAVKDTQYEVVARMIAAPNVLLQILAVGIIGPIMEEVLFRGLVYRRLRDYVGVFWAVILSAVVFGIAHGNLTQGLFAGLFGIVLALMYEHYGSLWAPCAGHIANNVFSIISTTYLVSLPGQFWLAFYLIGIVLSVVVIWKAFTQKKRINAF